MPRLSDCGNGYGTKAASRWKQNWQTTGLLFCHLCCIAARHGRYAELNWTLWPVPYTPIPQAEESTFYLCNVSAHPDLGCDRTSGVTKVFVVSEGLTQGGPYLVLRLFSSKQPKLGLTQELFSRISESTIGYTFAPCVGSFASPGIDTRQKGPPAFSVSS